MGKSRKAEPRVKKERKMVPPLSAVVQAFHCPLHNISGLKGVCCRRASPIDYPVCFGESRECPYCKRYGQGFGLPCMVCLGQVPDKPHIYFRAAGIQFYGSEEAAMIAASWGEVKEEDVPDSPFVVPRSVERMAMKWLVELTLSGQSWPKYRRIQRDPETNLTRLEGDEWPDLPM